ncbi:MAG: PIN domain-containing protein [Chloroflexota bacterium]
MTIRVFADANILIAGAYSSSGASRAVLMMGEIRLFKLVVSTQVLDEAERNIRLKLPHSLPTFAEYLSKIPFEVLQDPSEDESAKWEPIIEAKDAPVLAAAVLAKVDRILSLNTKDFTQDVADQCGVPIQTPGEFIQDIRNILDLGL